MLPLAALGALKGGGGMPGMSDQSMSSASATVNLAGMQVGGGYGQTSDIPSFIRAKMGGSTTEEASPWPLMMLAAAGVALIILLKR